MSLQDVCDGQSNESLQGFNISKDLIQVRYLIVIEMVALQYYNIHL